MRLVRRTLVCLVLASPALRLEAQQPDTTRADSARYTLPAIGVSVTRDERPIMAQPLAITRVDAAHRFGTRGYGIDEALQFVPGVLAQSRYGTSDVRLIIRGFGSRGAGDRSNSGTSRGIRVLLDGVPETEPDGRTAFDNLDMGLMRGIEVVRSNASPLWGNAAGGVVSFTTLDPNDPNGARAEAMGGSFGLQRGIVRGDLGLGRGKLALQGAWTSWDGWRAHSDARRFVLNASSSVPVGDHSRLGVTALATDNEFRIPGPLTQAQVDSAPEQANPTYAARDERRHNRIVRLAANLDHRWDSGSELSALAFVTPKYLQRSERNTYRDFTRYHVGASLLGRVRRQLGPTTRGALVVGADEAYQDGAILFYNLSPQGTRGDTLRDNKKEGANNAGVFVQGELDLGERWVLMGGARYDAIRYHSASFINPSLDDVKTFSRVTPKLGATYRMGPSHSVYANIGGGVEAPAGNETDPAGTFGQDTVYAINPLLDPISSTSFELGTRQVSAGRPGLFSVLSYDVAVYHTIVNNEIVPYRGGRFYFTAAESHRTGAELGLSAQMHAGFRFDASLAFSENTYASYVVDSVHYGVPGATADYSGNDIVGVPPVIYALGLGYTMQGGVPLTVRAVLEGTSSYHIDDANSVSVPAHGVVNLSAGFDRPVSLGGRLAVLGFVTVNNVFDTSYIGSAFLNPDVVGGVPVAFEPGLPRHVVVGFTLLGAEVAFALDEALAVLESTPRQLDAWLRDLPEAWVDARTEGPDSFSPRDVVGHLIGGERTDWIARTRVILQHGEARAFEPFDRFAFKRESAGKSIGELLDEFARLRRDNLDALRDLKLAPADLARRGRHPDKTFPPVTLQQLLATWVVHDLSHLAQIARVMARRYADDIGPWKAYHPIFTR